MDELVKALKSTQNHKACSLEITGLSSDPLKSLQ